MFAAHSRKNRLFFVRRQLKALYFIYADSTRNSSFGFGV
jgi:hypothetical protein